MQEVLLRQIKSRLEDIEKLLKWRVTALENTITRLRKLAYRCLAHEDDVAGCPCCAEGEIDRLRAVLRPFAAYFRDQSEVYQANPNNCLVWPQPGKPGVTIGHLRKAAEVFDPPKE